MGGGATQHLSQPEGTDTLLMPALTTQVIECCFAVHDST